MCIFCTLVSITISPGWSVTTLNYTPAWNFSSAGTTPTSIVYRLALRFQSHPGNITELFSPAPAQSVASVYHLRTGPVTHYSIFASSLPFCATCSRSSFPYVSFQRGVSHTLVPMERFELPTHGLKIRYSTC